MFYRVRPYVVGTSDAFLLLRLRIYIHYIREITNFIEFFLQIYKYIILFVIITFEERKKKKAITITNKVMHFEKELNDVPCMQIRCFANRRHPLIR